MCALGAGFDADDGAALYMTFRALQSESVKQGEAHKTIAHELATLVADPFGEWAAGHAVCLGFTRYYAVLKSFLHSRYALKRVGRFLLMAG